MFLLKPSLESRNSESTGTSQIGWPEFRGVFCRPYRAVLAAAWKALAGLSLELAGMREAPPFQVQSLTTMSEGREYRSAWRKARTQLDTALPLLTSAGRVKVQAAPTFTSKETIA